MKYNNIEIRPVYFDDAAKIATLHHTAFKDFFLTSLGKSFLKTFYESVLSHPNGLGCGAFIETELIGFAIGTKSNTGFYKSIVSRNGPALMFNAFWNLLLNPFKLKRLIQSFLTSGDLGYKGIPVLLSICVSNQSESKGIGKQLLAAFEDELKLNKFKELILTTDNKNNDYVNQFYLRNHFVKVQSFFQGKREMNLYHKKI